MMRHILLIISLLLAVTVSRAAEKTLVRSSDRMDVSFVLDLVACEVPSDQALLITPVLRSRQTADSLELPAIGVYGRRRFYHYQRIGMITGEGERVFRAGRLSSEQKRYRYQESLPYEEWMNDSELMLRQQRYGCCMSILAASEREVGKYLEDDFRDVVPAYLAGDPYEKLELRLEGSAMIQFAVDRTEIKPDWRDNYHELSKITHSIDTVKADPDFTITEVWLKGFASPESPYKHNAELARGRTEALKQYIQNLYRFADGSIIRTEFEPEDWNGLRLFVEKSNLEHRQEILDIIDNESNDDLDRKEWLLKSRYPQDYRFLLTNAYPPLRHTEYLIRYTVRRFADVDEIKRKIATEPYKLTLNDFYLAARTYVPGSPEFNNVYDVCARMYPDSEIANLNAANAALQSGNLSDAARFLSKAGSSPEAEYARGIVLLQQKRYAEARPFIETAVAADLPGAAEVLSRLLRVL